MTSFFLIRTIENKWHKWKQIYYFRTFKGLYSKGQGSEISQTMKESLKKNRYLAIWAVILWSELGSGIGCFTGEFSREKGCIRLKKKGCIRPTKLSSKIIKKLEVASTERYFVLYPLLSYYFSLYLKGFPTLTFSFVRFNEFWRQLRFHFLTNRSFRHPILWFVQNIHYVK